MLRSPSLHAGAFLLAKKKVSEQCCSFRMEGKARHLLWRPFSQPKALSCLPTLQAKQVLTQALLVCGNTASVAGTQGAKQTWKVLLQLCMLTLLK